MTIAGILFYCKRTCGICETPREWLTFRGIVYKEIDLIKNRFLQEELEKIIGHDPVPLYLNPRSDPGREHKMKLPLPDRKNAIQLVAEDPSLIKRPVMPIIEGVRFGLMKYKAKPSLTETDINSCKCKENQGNWNENWTV